MSQDIEMLESTSPITVLHFEYLPSSAGVGENRGGYGLPGSLIRFDGNETSLASFGDGMGQEGSAPPYGLFGGKPGTANSLKVIFPDGHVNYMGSKELLTKLPRGTVVNKLLGGGGGYGNPIKRSKSKVADEIRSGLLSFEKAHQEYGFSRGIRCFG